MSDAVKCCRHCGRAKVNRPRGLCWTCYYTPGVPAMYPPTSKFARRSAAGVTAAKVSQRPTAARPGSTRKVEVLIRRAQRNQALWHPGDAGFGDDEETT